MNPILQAIQQGYSPEDILKYISQSIPSLVPKVQKAISSGYSLKEVIGFLAKTSGNNDVSGLSESQIHARNRQVDSELTQKGLMAVGALAASPLAASTIRSAFSRALPQNLAQNLPQIANAGNVPSGGMPPMSQSSPQAQVSQSISPIGQQAAQTSLQPPVNPANIPQQAQQNQAPSAMPSAPISPSSPPVQPEVNNMPTKTPDVRGILDKYGLSQHVDKLSERNKDPKQIAAVLYSRFPKEMKQFQDEAGKNMEDAIGDYLASSQNALKPTELVENPQISPKNAKNPSLNEKKSLKVDEPSYNSPEEKPIAKSDIVASPQGVGEVKEVRGGEAVIDVDGKLHKVKEDELIPSPIPEKDLATLYDDMIQGIEKETGQQVSRNVEWAGYDPKSNELAYKPHQSGRLYVYDDISPEDVNLLTNFLTKRKSTGENFIGAWQAGTESPIGAAMYQLIKKLQAERGGKGNEYKNRYETIYDAIEPAKEAKKRKYAEERKKKAKKPRLD